MSELKPCPFCGSSFVEISRFGNSKVSTFYQCNDCGVSLETSETFNHGTQWNNRPHENKIKAEAVAEFIEQFKDPDETSQTMYDWLKRGCEKYANKLEKGEL